jgi:hypothetical protein
MKRYLPALVLLFLTLHSPAQDCPASVKVNTSSYEVTEGDTITFIAEVKPTPASATYNWSVSSGTIASGQGTTVIQVITDGFGGMSITATADLGGYPRNCITYSSSTVNILKAPEKIISANYTTAQDLTAAVKKFITQTDLKNIDISQTAFIYIYSSATTTATQLKAINSAIIKEFEKNGVLSFQYKIADGGKKKTASFEMYRLMPGSHEPRPSK